MPVPRQNFPNAGHFYSNIFKPIKLDLQFAVAAANANGLGITSLKSNGYVRNVFMHTSQTPGSNDGALNPNPAVGIALIQLKNNFNTFLGMDATVQSPVTGSALTSTTAGNVYQIVTVGTTTAAQWLTNGLPAGITAAPGVAYVSIATGAIGGTGTVKALAPSGTTRIEIAGNPILTNNTNIYSSGGLYLIAQFLGATSSSVTTLIPEAPLDTSVVNMSLYFDASSVTVDGL